MMIKIRHTHCTSRVYQKRRWWWCLCVNLHKRLGYFPFISIWSVSIQYIMIQSYIVFFYLRWNRKRVRETTTRICVNCECWQQFVLNTKREYFNFPKGEFQYRKQDHSNIENKIEKNIIFCRNFQFILIRKICRFVRFPYIILSISMCY